MRGDLCRIIYDIVKDRTKYIFGRSVESVEERIDCIRVRLTDGTTDQFDLLVGADGQGSCTRKMMFGTGKSNGFNPLGESYIGYFTVPRAMQAGEQYLSTWYFATDHRFIMTRRNNPDTMQMYLCCEPKTKSLPNAYHGSVSEQKEALSELFLNAGWQTADILKGLEETHDFYLEQIGMVKLKSWSQGRMVLVGDAAYGPSTRTGMGTTSAVIGAYILAGEIGKQCSDHDPKDLGSSKRDRDFLKRALTAYEEKFRPFMEQVVEGVEDQKLDGLPTTPFGIAVMNCLLGVVSFLKLNYIGRWVLKENVRGWNLPKYTMH
jgi:2-polyprenyl-6-methoxyphenol hydroxylase-like FAD-dependent oxidoreductase